MDRAGTTDVDVRWSRLFEEHARQAAQRPVETPSRLRWLWRGIAGAVLVVVVLGLVLLRIETARIADPARCPLPAGAAEAQVDPGGWGSPDGCVYFTPDGSKVQRTETFAGSVVRSQGDVVADSAWWLVPVGLGGLVALGTVAARRR